MEEMMMRILNARENRVEIINELIKSNNVVICLRANYPGINKDNKYSRFVVEKIDEIISDLIGFKNKKHLNEGEGLVVIYENNTLTIDEIKKKTVDIEENNQLGRLVDIDVYYKNIEAISRSQLGLKGRKCFLCEEFAHKCIRSKAHNIDEVEQFFMRVVEEYGT